jgi:hypothetical protein
VKSLLFPFNAKKVQLMNLFQKNIIIKNNKWQICQVKQKEKVIQKYFQINRMPNTLHPKINCVFYLNRLTKN